MIKTILKFAFSIALLYWLIASGKFDFSSILNSFKFGNQWAIAFFLVAFQSFLGVYRYKLLLQTKSKESLPFLKLVKLHYIGLFFSSVLPGAVTGDLIKVMYVKKIHMEFTNTFVVSITLLDRIIGLSALLFLSGLFSLIFYNQVCLLSPHITQIIFLNLFLFLSAMCFLGILISPFRFQKIIIDLSFKIPWIGAKISSLFTQLFLLRESRPEILKCFLLSIFTQFLSILSFWVIASPAYSGHLPFYYAFTFIPIGLIATTIPISPGGLGVGHVLFANLFSLIKINNGAAIFNLFFVLNFFHNFIGVIPYILTGKSKLPSD